MSELMDNEQGGREYEAYYQDIICRAKEQWMEETNGSITFDTWLDGGLNGGLNIPEPKYDLGDRVDIKYGGFIQQDAIVVGYEYFNPEIGDKEIWGYDYHVVYQLSNGEWERESYSEEYLS